MTRRQSPSVRGLAIGGWATDNGNPIEVTSGNPAYLECDWVRVWTKNPAMQLPEGNLRFYSMETGQCLTANGYDVELGDCKSRSGRCRCGRFCGCGR